MRKNEHTSSYTCYVPALVRIRPQATLRILRKFLENHNDILPKTQTQTTIAYTGRIFFSLFSFPANMNKIKNKNGFLGNPHHFLLVLPSSEGHLCRRRGAQGNFKHSSRRGSEESVSRVQPFVNNAEILVSISV